MSWMGRRHPDPGEPGEPGERGPHGDHGQHGDEGPAGDAGVQGERGQAGIAGERGKVGDTGLTGVTGPSGPSGREGPRGPQNWRGYVAMGIAIIAALVVFLAVDAKRQTRVAQTALSNCQQIELVKTEIRKTVQQSLVQLPKLAYYRRHPAELAEALARTRDSIERFASLDCYALPNVRDAGLRPPQPSPPRGR